MEGGGPHRAGHRRGHGMGPAHVRTGLRRRGGKGIVRTNHSKKAIHLIGAPGDGTLDLQFHVDLKADSYAAPEYARRLHEKQGSAYHNAGALTGKTMRDYTSGTNGAGEMVHIPPPHPAAQPHRDAAEGDQGGHSGHIRRP